MEKIKIAKQKLVPLESLIINADNPKTITEENFKRLQKSLDEDEGFLESLDILVYELDGEYHVIGGNHRVLALRQNQKKKDEQVAVTIYDVFTDGKVDEKKLWSAILLHGAHYGRYDLEKLFKGFDKEFLKEIDLPQLNTILAELDEVKVEKHGSGQALPDYDFRAKGTQMIKLHYTPEEKAELEGFYNLHNDDDGVRLSEFILNTLRQGLKLKK